MINSLSNKTVANEKVIEFKKQLVSNKSLKSYFAEHQEEKEILLNDIDKVQKRANKYLYKNLDVMPGYVIPENIMAMTGEQLAQCTLGTASVIPGNTNHNRSLSKFPVQMVESDS